MKKTITIVGDALMDNQYYIDEMPTAGQDIKINDFAKSTGGSAANTAAKLASLGLYVCLCTCVGDDEDGRFFKKRLDEKGVDTSLVQLGGKTGFTVTMIDNHGERTMMSYRGASARVVKMTKSLEENIKTADVLLVSGYWMMDKAQAKFALDAAAIANSDKTIVAYDPCPIVGQVDKEVLAAMIEKTDILLPNETEYDYIKANASIGRDLCVAIKLGSAGSKLLYCGQRYSAPAKKIKAVDTTGAGDAFNAGFIAAMQKGKEPRQWLREGNECAAQAVSRRGAV